MPKGVLVLGLKSVGCPSCITPAKARLLQVKGVIGVHIALNKVTVIYDPETTNPAKILEESGLRDYYKVEWLENRVIDEGESPNYILRFSRDNYRITRKHH